jgi:UDP-N-acetylmuramoyl-tripeptide--D-alanyl-D-alanine ligase
MLLPIMHILCPLLIVLVCGPAREPKMERVTFDELSAATGGRPVGCESSLVAFQRVSTDSRTIEPGELFWALRGDCHNGHDFLPEADRRAATGCVVEDVDAPRGRMPAVVVRNTLTGLRDFAVWHRRRVSALVVGVTGTVGKTTTREMIHSVLSARFAGCRSRKNFNNHIGLPLSVLDIERSHHFAVLELGASGCGEIAALAGVAMPEFGVVTRIGVGHLDGFGSIEAIAQTKGELVEALPAGGLAILNGDDNRCRELARRARSRVATVGQSADNAFRVTTIQTTPHQLRFRMDGAAFAVAAAGRHHLVPAAVAVLVGLEMGLTHSQIAEGLTRFTPVDGRCHVLSAGGLTVIDDTYNANPTSMQAACELLRDWPSTGRRILVSGDMAELGEQSAAWHESSGRVAAQMGIDRLAAFGRYAIDVVRGAREQGLSSGQLTACEEINQLLAVLERWVQPGDVVLVKGSRCMRMERVAKWLVGQPEKTNTDRVEARGLAYC